MGIDPDKYIVFNRRDYEQGKTVFSTATANPPVELHDSVVIRLQDVFAPIVLTVYAQQIELLLRHGGDIAPEQRRNLIDLQAYFFELALRAEEMQGQKLPSV